MGSTNWNAIAASAAVFHTLVVTIAAYWALKQTRAAVDMRRLEAMSRVHDELRETRDLRREAYAFPSLGSMTEAQWSTLDNLATRIDRLAHVVAPAPDLERELLSSHSLPLAKLWIRVFPYVEAHRREPGRAGYVRGFEQLAQKATKALQAGNRNLWSNGVSLLGLLRKRLGNEGVGDVALRLHSSPTAVFWPLDENIRRTSRQAARPAPQPSGSAAFRSADAAG